MMVFEQKIRISEGLTKDRMAMAVDFAFWLGFHSVSAVFPVASIDGDLEIPLSRADLEKYRPQVRSSFSHDFVPSIAPDDLVDRCIEGQAIGVESLLERGDVLVDRDNDFLPDRIDLKFILPDSASAAMMVAICDLAFRLGMETTAFEGSLVASDDHQGNRISFEEGERCALRLDGFEQKMLGVKQAPKHFVLTGKGQELIDLSSAICNIFPLADEGMSLVHRLYRMVRSLENKDLEGQLSDLIAKGKEFGISNDGKIRAFLSTTDRDLSSIEKRYPQFELHSHREKVLKYAKQYEPIWEVEELDRELEKLYPKLKRGDKLFLQIAVSEDLKQREGIKRRVERELDKNGIEHEVEVICTYKQGFSWIVDVILPQLKVAIKEFGKTENAVDKIRIGFKPFLPKGVTTFQEEDGAIPTYGADANKLGKWLDLPIRSLQELYPVADILIKELALDREKIEFVQLDADYAHDYRIECIGAVDLVAEYDLATDERLYLEEYSQMGLVHPPTGYLRAKILRGEEKIEFESRIRSDVEKVWDLFQSEMLPKLKNYLLEKYGGKIDPKDQPFLAEMRMIIELSEPNERIGEREDLISSLDSLHEDLYFTTIEYLKCFGIDQNVVIDAPALILPIIRKCEGAPVIRFELWDHISDIPFIEGPDSSSRMYFEKPQTEALCYVEELSWDEGLTLSIRVKNVDVDHVRAYAELVEKQIVEGFGDYSKVELRTADRCFVILGSSSKEILPAIDIMDVDLMEGKLIGYEEYLQIIEQLKRVKGIRVDQMTRSFQGRKIYAIELLPSWKGYVSRTKRLSLYPSMMINARHHANEVSGTNASFILLRELLTSKKYQDLANKMTLAIIPMENVDGSAIHYSLQQDNPNWILHTARFNAVGREFARDLFDPETISTEALAQTRLWKRILPDVYVDDHGVPSHEWAQPFSGYTAPAYKGFWLPRSILYGYFWTIDDPRYAQNIPLNQRMEDVIADAIGADEEITRLNKEWMWQFESYAHRWMPKQYPADYYKNMINYWIGFRYDPMHKYMSIRFPWITSIGYTSEVADETAHGDYLKLCSRAHLLHNLATIDMLLDAEHVIKQSYGLDPWQATLRRERPFCIRK